VRTKIVPVIIGALGTVKKGLGHSLQLVPGHLSATELHKVTLMSTAQHTSFVVLGLSGFDLLLRSGLNRRLPHTDS